MGQACRFLCNYPSSPPQDRSLASCLSRSLGFFLLVAESKNVSRAGQELRGSSSQPEGEKDLYSFCWPRLEGLLLFSITLSRWRGGVVPRLPPFAHFSITLSWPSGGVTGVSAAQDHGSPLTYTPSPAAKHIAITPLQTTPPRETGARKMPPFPYYFAGKKNGLF